MTDTTPVDASSWTAAVVAGPLGIAAAVYGLLLVVGERLLNDPDTFWHIAAGRWIWANGAVPSVDPFSHTLLSAPWVAHEWLAELILAGAYGAAGWAGVVALAALAVAASLALLIRALERFVRPTVALGAAAMAFFLMAAHLTARPHVLALPILVAWATGLVRARAKARAPSFALLPLMVLWANLHGGFIVGLGLAGAFAVEAVLLAPGGAARKAAILHWGGFVLGTAAASLLTPHGLSGWWFPFKLMSLSFALNFVGEWHAPEFGLFQPLEIWLLALAAFALAIRLQAPLFRVLLVAGLVAMALSHTRNAELLALLTPLILAEPVGRRLSSVTPARKSQPRAAAAIALVFVAMTGAAVWRGYPHENPAIAPKAALAAAERAGFTGPVFNDYDFGGYLIFRGIAPFVDGRVDLYGDDFMRAYANALNAEDDALPRLLDRYRVTWTLLPPRVPAAAALDRLEGWERVYADSDAVVHRRR